MDSDLDEVNNSYMDGDSYDENESDWEDINLSNYNKKINKITNKKKIIYE